MPITKYYFRGNLERMAPWYGNLLKEYRKKKNLTQTQLAEIVGCSKNNISNIEQSQYEPSAYRHFTFVDALGTEFHWAVVNMWRLTNVKKNNNNLE